MMKHKVAEWGGEGSNQGFHVDQSRVSDLNELEEAKPEGPGRVNPGLQGRG